MSKAKMNMSWDGEKIKIATSVPDEKVTPKQFMDGLNNAKNNLTQAIQNKQQAEGQIKEMDNAIQSIESFLADRNEYVDKCNELMMTKLDGYIKTLSQELIKKAEEEAQKIIDNDPNALTDVQKISQKYVIYQKLLATHPKVAENISQDIIRDCLFEKPVFSNPFAQK